MNNADNLNVSLILHDLGGWGGEFISHVLVFSQDKLSAISGESKV